MPTLQAQAQQTESTRPGAGINKIKSLFIGAYMPFAMSSAGYAAYMLSQGELMWISILLTTLPIALFLMTALVLKPFARTSKHLPVITVLGAAGIGYAEWLWVSEQAPVLILLWSIAAFVLFQMYNYWYSSLGRKASSKIKVGHKLPDFILTNSSGDTVHSSSFEGKQTLFMFYRGNWCPLCMAQIKEVAKHYQQIAKSGTEIVLISPQPHSNTESIAKKFAVPFNFMTDKNNSAANVLNIAMANGLPAGMEVLGYDSDTVYPTVIITDKKAVIIFVDQTDNYRIRPEPETFLPYLKMSKA